MDRNMNTQPQTGNWLSRLRHEVRVAGAVGGITLAMVGGMIVHSVAEAGPGTPCNPTPDLCPTPTSGEPRPTNPGKTTPSSVTSSTRPSTSTSRVTTTTRPSTTTSEIVTTTTSTPEVTTTTTPNIVTTTTPETPTTPAPPVVTTVRTMPPGPTN